MKIGIIVILLLAVGFLFYQNHHLKKQIALNRNVLQSTQREVLGLQSNLIRRSNQMATPSSSTTPFTSPPVARSSPTISNAKSSAQERLDRLIQDRQQVQAQIKEMNSENLAAQIQQRQSDLNTLQNQLKSYQGSNQSIDRNSTSVLQFQRTLNQQTLELLNTRIRNQERVVRNTRRDLVLANRNADLYQNDRIAWLNTQLAQQQTELQNLTAQKEAVAAQGVQQTSDLGDQMNHSKAALSYAQSAIQSQMNVIRQDIDSLNRRKDEAQTTLNQYKQDLQQLNQAIQEQRQTLKEAQ